ncbi:MAG: sugar phosphate isomerase/epimerase [Gemmatimonadaceae bacterium]|nr:sugar phosphate isomerase/epimerase [Gemmatimonadaceae bacterium]
METHTISRRNVLQMLAAGVAGGALLPRLATARAGTADEARRIERIGLQLYTVRTAMTKDLEGTIAAVAAAGITELEFAGYYNKPATWWRDLMKSHGMTSPSTHIGLPKTDAEWEPHFAMANGMGHDCVIVPSFGSEFRGEGGYKRLADRLNSSGELAKKAGLRMGYHNHDAEFAPQAVGTNGFEILVANTDPKLVDFELDLYWAVKAGQDPLKLIAAHPKRIAYCHVKDAGPAPELAMMDVGAGTIDFKTILKAARKVGLKHWYIEHDAPKDALASITASAAALKKL